MTQISLEEIEKQIDILKKEILPQLMASEAHTFEIRPSISHSDIEIFMNDGLYCVDSKHFRRVVDGNLVPSFTKQILLRLRGKDSLIIPQYNFQQVQKEINYVLINLIGQVLTMEEETKLDESIRDSLSQVFTRRGNDPEYSAGQYRFINGKYILELLRRIRKTKKNG